MQRLLGLLFVVTLLLAAGVALSAPNSPDISWWSVDGGAVPRLSGGSYTLQGTAGQADAGGMSNGRYALSGGYWNPAHGPSWNLYLPVLVKS